MIIKKLLMLTAIISGFSFVTNNGNCSNDFGSLELSKAKSFSAVNKDRPNIEDSTQQVRRSKSMQNFRNKKKKQKPRWSPGECGYNMNNPRGPNPEGEAGVAVSNNSINDLRLKKNNMSSFSSKGTYYDSREIDKIEEEINLDKIKEMDFDINEY